MITGNISVGYFFQKDTVSRTAPIIKKKIIVHLYVMCKHYSYAGFIIFKDITNVSVMVRKHKMDSVAYVVVAPVSPYQGIGYKFKVQTIAMSCNIVTYNKQTIRPPAMNTIAALYFIGSVRFYLIIFYNAVTAVLAINSEIGIIQFIINNTYFVAVFNKYPGKILCFCPSSVYYFKTIEHRPISMYGKNTAHFFSIYYRIL